MDSATDKPLWLEIRRSDGSVLARRGSAGARLFSTEDESAHFRNREPLYKVVPASVGETVVEVFPLRSVRPGALPRRRSRHRAPRPPRRTLVVVEIAAPLAVRDASVIWPIRRNLAINCSGALALLATVVIAGLGFRSYARGRRLELQVEIARQVQSELLPSRDGGLGPRPPGDRLPACRAGERRLLRRVPRRRRPHRGRDRRRLRQGRARGARDGRDPRRRALQRVVGIHVRARAGVRSAEPPAVREGAPSRVTPACSGATTSRRRAGSATSTRDTTRRSWSARGTTRSRSRASTPAARCSAFFPRRATSRPAATSARETCSSSTPTA